MTINEAHEILFHGLVNAPSEHEWCVAFEMAINIMPKYQKIQEVIKSWKDGTIEEKDSIYAFHEIMKVIGD